MTVPINSVHVGTTGVVTSPTDKILEALFQGSEIGLRQQALNAEQQRIAGEKERIALEQQKFKAAELQHQEEKDQLARLGEVARALLMGMEPQTELPAGSIPFGAAAQSPVTVGATSPFAQMLRSLPAAQVAQVLPLLQQMSTMQGTAAKTQGQVLDNVQAVQRMENDKTIRDIVSGLESQPLNRQTIGRVITKVAAIDPAKAASLASSISSLVPGYSAHINPNGTVSWVSNAPGGVAGAPLQPAPGDADQRKAAGYARRVLEANATMTSLEKKYPGMAQWLDDRIRMARTAGQLPAVGRSLETMVTPELLRQWSKGGLKYPMQAFREYFNARMDLGNAILRRESGAAITVDELDRELTPYTPMFRMGEDVVPSIQKRRLALGLQYADAAGVEFRPDRLSPLARRYLLRAMTGQEVEPTPQTIPGSPAGTTLVPR